MQQKYLLEKLPSLRFYNYTFPHRGYDHLKIGENDQKCVGNLILEQGNTCKFSNG